MSNRNKSLWGCLSTFIVIGLAAGALAFYWTRRVDESPTYAPATSPPFDPICIDFSSWHDRCQEFNNDTELCSTIGMESDIFGTTAMDACCACEGGNQEVYGLQPSCFENDPERFNICLDLASSSGEYEPWMDTFIVAKTTWENVISNDVGDALPSGNMDPVFTSTGAYPAMIDDVYVAAKSSDIDGEYNILGFASISHLRSGDYNPRIGHPYRMTLSGSIWLDTGDIRRLVTEGTLQNVILHEMGHVLGFGSLWEQNGLYSSDNGVYASDSRAQAEWSALGCTGPIPVEQEGGYGRTDVHWSEACMRHELMTGDLSGLDQPLSRITLGTFNDLGYADVDYSQADPFTRADLGDCGLSCPNLRHLRSTPVGSNYKPLNETAYSIILDFAKSKFETTLGAMSKQAELLPEGVLFVGDQVLDVIYQDQDGKDGPIRVFQVRPEDVRTSVFGKK